MEWNHICPLNVFRYAMLCYVNALMSGCLSSQLFLAQMDVQLRIPPRTASRTNWLSDAQDLS
jgi:hypothetical protein